MRAPPRVREAVPRFGVVGVEDVDLAARGSVAGLAELDAQITGAHEGPAAHRHLDGRHPETDERGAVEGSSVRNAQERG